MRTHILQAQPHIISSPLVYVHIQRDDFTWTELASIKVSRSITGDPTPFINAVESCARSLVRALSPTRIRRMEVRITDG